MVRISFHVLQRGAGDRSPGARGFTDTESVQPFSNIFVFKITFQIFFQYQARKPSRQKDEN